MESTLAVALPILVTSGQIRTAMSIFLVPRFWPSVHSMISKLAQLLRQGVGTLSRKEIRSDFRSVRRAVGGKDMCSLQWTWNTQSRRDQSIKIGKNCSSNSITVREFESHNKWPVRWIYVVRFEWDERRDETRMRQNMSWDDWRPVSHAIRHDTVLSPSHSMRRVRPWLWRGGDEMVCGCSRAHNTTTQTRYNTIQEVRRYQQRTNTSTKYKKIHCTWYNMYSFICRTHNHW